MDTPSLVYIFSTARAITNPLTTREKQLGKLKRKVLVWSPIVDSVGDWKNRQPVDCI